MKIEKLKKLQMKKLTFFIPFIIIACSKKEVPECNAEDVKQTVLEIIKEERLKNKGFFAKEDELILAMDSMSLELIRPQEINEELKKCNCEAVLKGYPITFDDLSEKNVNLDEVKEIKDNGINILYSAQKVENEEIIVEVEPFMF